MDHRYVRLQMELIMNYLDKSSDTFFYEFICSVYKLNYLCKTILPCISKNKKAQLLVDFLAANKYGQTFHKKEKSNVSAVNCCINKRVYYEVLQ